MGTSVVRPLSDQEMAQLPLAREAMAAAGSAGTSSHFNFFAAFDGTNNDKNNLKLAGDPHQTNVGNLFEQADRRRSASFEPAYFPGVGTGGDQGNIVNAGVNPSPAIEAAAEKAYTQFSDAALKFLRSHPDATPADLGASVVGFSRGCATAVRFAQLLNERGLVAPDGTVVAPPGSVPITAMALMDPVATGVDGDLGIPPNVNGQVLVVQGQHENRSLFRPLDYRDDPRVVTVQHPGNHVGIGGGYDLQGTAANVREGLTSYFRNSGLPLAEVPPGHRHDPSQRAMLYTENYQTAHNGDLLTDENGRPRSQWSVDNPDKPRVTVKPQMSEQHKAWLQQAYIELAPRLKAQGMSPEQCLQVSAACVASASEHGDWGPPGRFMLSKDGARVVVQHQSGRFDELTVADALQTSTNTHLERAQAAQPNPSQTPPAPPERATPVVSEPVHAR